MKLFYNLNQYCDELSVLSVHSAQVAGGHIVDLIMGLSWILNIFCRSGFGI